MSETENNKQVIEDGTEDDSGLGVVKITMIVTGVLTGLILLIFVAGLIIAVFADSAYWAPRFRIIRDSFVLLMALESIMIVISLAVLVIQVARLANLLQSEVKPVLDNAQETLSTAKGTTQFVGKNVAEPVIKFQAFFAGLWVFIRELGGIRRAIRKKPKSE